MPTTQKFGFFAVLSFLALSAPADAQVWGNGPIPREGACFYRDANYKGQYFCVPAGQSLNNLPRSMRDNISSIRVTGRADVVVFDGPSFRGQARRVDDDVKNLSRAGGWNDAISSVRVEREGFDQRGRFGDNDRGRFGGDRDDRVGRANRGQYVDAMIRSAYQDVLRREPDPEGFRVYRQHIIDEGWNDAQLRDALRNSREYRELQRRGQDRGRFR
ncbi:MAG: peptidase inhibitor family I36 protein [Vicinamibacterales bacterium]